MQNYELTFIASGKASDSQQKVLLGKVKKLLLSVDGKIAKTTDWGKREFAFPIEKESEGVYFHLTIDLPQDKVQEVDRALAVDEEVLRHLLIKI